ncbi:Glyoxylase, beta-lactamase superfamily II [Allopseudospirillum japonicum]|uniref:Glyoxylase, beta-lactamase superfamily II n=1 Tax=Allopseudospirillum japonicum TaxID=64971 RepID=A0A1H6QEP9_9GAMM|nr:Glyoxylase, beta-lactamase superfamily II [Allopseudospirillum japonicum]
MSEIQYRVIPVTPFAQNASLIWCTQTKEAAIIDPGGDIQKLLAAVAEEGVNLTKLLITHAHIDHAGAAGELAEQYDLPIEGPHQEDDFWIQGLPQQSQMFGFPPAKHFQPTRWLTQGDQVQLGQATLDVLHCPGHTPGHVVFVHQGRQRAFVGDVLFAGSIGRTDFPRGDHQTLLNSIREQLWPLGNLTFIPGHGPESTFAQERATNPFVADAVLGR